MAISPAKIISERSFVVPGKLKITEYFFQVPRDYSSPSSGTLQLFARGARRHDVPADPESDSEANDNKSKKSQLPWLLFLQGGPGFECRPPQQCGWTNFFLDKGYQMLYMDQRGTGLSNPVSAATLGLRGDDAVQAQYLKSFRADSIVKDAEAIRQALTADYPAKKKQWSVLGQSFGGFCITTYLSTYPEGLREAFITGGLPPLVDGPDEVYRRLAKKLVQRNEKYYEKFPEDIERVKTIVRFLRRHGEATVRLPDEGVLTAQRFMGIGMAFGAHGGIDTVHEIVLRANSELSMHGFLTRHIADSIARSLSFDTNVINAVLHEPIYCQGTAPNWSADRIINSTPEFDIEARLEDPSAPLYFLGEMILPQFFTSFSELTKLAPLAHALARDSSWPALYSRPALAHNKVPVYATIYKDDMYVDYEFALETAHAIRGCKYFVTNGLYHDAIRSRTEEVVARLWALRTDCMD